MEGNYTAGRVLSDAQRSHGVTLDMGQGCSSTKTHSERGLSLLKQFCLSELMNTSFCLPFPDFCQLTPYCFPCGPLPSGFCLRFLVYFVFESWPHSVAQISLKFTNELILASNCPKPPRMILNPWSSWFYFPSADITGTCLHIFCTTLLSCLQPLLFLLHVHKLVLAPQMPPPQCTCVCTLSLILDR